MNLNNFENNINKKILARGYDYYENDQVISVEEIQDNVYEAEVEGSEYYTVEVELDNAGNIIEAACDCPYDLGEYCKHQVAVFLVLRDKKHSISPTSSCIPKASKGTENVFKDPVPRSRKTSNIEKILSERTKDELVEILLNITAEYEEIKQRIELDFDNENDEVEINKAIGLIRTFVRKNSDKHGYVIYGDTGDAIKGADMVLEKARVDLNIINSYML